MNMLWVVFSVSGVLLDVETSVGNVVPTGFRLVDEVDVSAIVPSQPSGHLL